MIDQLDAAAKLAESEEQFRLLAENSADIVIRVRDGVCIWVSPSIEEVLGAPPAHWTGRPTIDLIAPGQDEAHRARMAKLAAGEKLQERILLQAFDGSVHWAHLRANTFRDAQGRIDGFVGALRLIDDEVAAEQRAEEARLAHEAAEAGYRTAMEADRALLRASADSMLDPQIVLEAVRDATGQLVDFRYMSINRAANLYLGAPEDQMVGRTLFDTYPTRFDAELLARYGTCLADGKPVILTNFSYSNQAVGEDRYYDIRATKAGPDLLTLTWSDVTGRYQAARRLAKSEEKYRLLSQNTSDAVTHVRDGRFVWVSPSIENIVGAPAEHWIGRDVREIIPPEEMQTFIEQEAILVAGGTVQRRFQVKAVDGARHWVHGHSTPFFDADGRQDGFTGTLRLIDDEVAAEEEIAEVRRQRARTDALYRRSMESTAVGMCLADRDGKFVEVNPALCRFFGYDSAAMLEKTWRQLTAPDYIDADLDRRSQFLAGDIDSYRMVKKFIRADGEAIWGELTLSCIRSADGEIETFIGHITDMTNEVRVREELEEARRQQALADRLFRRSIDSAAVGMCLIDAEGRFIDVNDALCQFFGYDAGALKALTWQQLTAPAFLEADLSKVTDMLAGRLDSYRLLKQYIHADGHLIWGDLSVSCIRSDAGRVERFVVQITDMTATVAANERNAELHRRLMDELRSAASYMASIMPAGLSGPVRISSRYLPSQELGGDCFDYGWIDDDHLMVHLIDVSGHGIEPALLAVSLLNMVRSGSLPVDMLGDPAAILTELNRLFQMEHQNDHFFTMWYGVYERTTRTLRYASAGAPPAYLFTPTTDGLHTVAELGSTSAPAGAFEDTPFTTVSHWIAPGAGLLTYSDGASELPLADGRQLSQKGFRSLVTRTAAEPGWSLDELVDRLRDRTANGDFTDDVSLIHMVFD